jgi:macrolide-specific efflux system membrane fusion protein
MLNKKLKPFVTIIVIACIAVFVFARFTQKKPSDEITSAIKPAFGSITLFISCTGTVLPKNRLEIKPPVNGRIESVLVHEGEKVKTGQTLAWMSSTERAALLDAARGKGEKSLQYWEETYKPIPLLAPIDGEVIVATTQPGQTVTTSDAVVVLSDHLIVRAQVDETDIGKIRPDEKAIISLDAYPDTKINAAVEHIYYESETVNNVTIYSVDLAPVRVPPFFRSGMNATVDFIDEQKNNILLIPVEALHKDQESSYVLVQRPNGAAPVKTTVTTGISDDKDVEIVSGVTKNDAVVVKGKKYSIPTSSEESNPFMPSRRKK